MAYPLFSTPATQAKYKMKNAQCSVPSREALPSCVTIRPLR